MRRRVLLIALLCLGLALVSVGNRPTGIVSVAPEAYEGGVLVLRRWIEPDGSTSVGFVSFTFAEPGTWNPICRQGETFVRVITWKDSTGALVNLTGYTAKLQLRDISTGTVVDEFTDTTGLALGGALGTITWTVTATETAALPTGASAYDLRLTSGTSVVTVLLAGHLNVQARITQ